MSAQQAYLLKNKTELFVDDFLIEEMTDAQLHLHAPRREEVVWQNKKPWESMTSTYFTVLSDGEKILLYYRGYRDDIGCLAYSEDGIHFERPELGLYEFEGSKQNNIVYQGGEAHNFAPFLDRNPKTPPAEKFKNVCGYPVLHTLASPDGIHWHRLREEPVITQGAFDSQNVAFYDAVAGLYRCYSRVWTQADGTLSKPGGEAVGVGVRAIQHCTSPDSLNWTQPQPLTYGPGSPIENFYTNATCPVPGAPHILVAFPMRFLEERKKVEEHFETGVSDTVFMSSRDGQYWDRSFTQAWLRPGLDRRNWTDRSNMTASGVLQTSPHEYSCYITEHYRWNDNRLRRYSIRKDGFASIQAQRKVGTVLTKPVVLDGNALYLNYSTSAAGFVQVEICDLLGQPIEGFTQNQMPPLYGDDIDHQVQWQQNPSLASLKEQKVRLRFTLSDADIFSIRIGA
jgi:hypothetical protein